MQYTFRIFCVICSEWFFLTFLPHKWALCSFNKNIKACKACNSTQAYRYMCSCRDFLCVAARKLWTIPCPTLLGQIHNHGSQLRWVSADGRIRNGWSNCADTKHQLAAVALRGQTTWGTQTRLRPWGLTVLRQSSSDSTLLKTREVTIDNILHPSAWINIF